MAKIKTSKLLIDGQEWSINYNCSPTGVFSVSIPMDIRLRLGIEDGRITGEKLEEIEKVVNEAHSKYIKSKTSLKLKIGISFGASGEFVKDLNDEFIREFMGYQNKFLVSTFSTGFRSLLALDFQVIIEEDRNGVVTQYEGIPLEKHTESKIYEWKKVCQGYIDKDKIHRFNDHEKVIEFSETALNNLISLKNQLKKASIFLIHLLNSEDFEMLINSDNIKLLK